jgi:hypothetical protein
VNSEKPPTWKISPNYAFNLIKLILHRLEKNSAEIPIMNIPQLNHSSSQPSDPEEKSRKQCSALTAAFKDPQTQFGGNIHGDYAEVLDSYCRLAEGQGLDSELKTKLFTKHFEMAH